MGHSINTHPRRRMSSIFALNSWFALARGTYVHALVHSGLWSPERPRLIGMAAALPAGRQSITHSEWLSITQNML
eukprot:938679-Heterocapsa_arctica.AAC.1